MVQVSNGIILTGLKNFDGVKIENDEVKISSSALGTDTVTLIATGIYKDYKLTLGSDVTVGNELWLLNGGTLSYKANEGYLLSGNKILHRTAGAFSISGLKDIAVYIDGRIDGVEITGNSIAISADIATANVKLETTGDYKLSVEDNSNSADDEKVTTVAEGQAATDDDVTDFLDDIFNGG